MSLDRKAARAREAAATPGPWLTNEYYQCVQTGSGDLGAVVRFGNIGPRVPLDDYMEAPKAHPEIANADFIAHARADLPAALDLLDEAAELMARYQRLYYPGPDVDIPAAHDALRALNTLLKGAP